MLTILFTIILGANTYKVANACGDLGGTYFPKDDTKESRVLSICSKYGADQNFQIETHELLHICMHDHQHTYTTDVELKEHLQKQMYSEEYFATIVAPCLVENEVKLQRALEAHHVYLHNDVRSNTRRARRWTH